MAGWSGGEDKETEMALDRSVELGCNFFDTAYSYGAGKSEKNNIAIITRVPFDEGSLTGTLNTQSTGDNGDFRNLYFCQENLIPTLERVQNVTNELPAGMSLPKLALRFIKHHPAVSTVIPGMRKIRNVENNMKIGSDKNESFTTETLAINRKHRWDR